LAFVLRKQNPTENRIQNAQSILAKTKNKHKILYTEKEHAKKSKFKPEFKN